jgi:plastocyanin
MPSKPALCLTTIALVATGCGTEDPPDIPGSARAGEPLVVVAREYLFSPNRVTIRGAKGPIEQEIVLRNRGELAHNIEVLQDDRVVGKLRSFPSNQERPLAVPLGAGSYRFVCTVADHDEKGMRGSIEVR